MGYGRLWRRNLCGLSRKCSEGGRDAGSWWEEAGDKDDVRWWTIWMGSGVGWKGGSWVGFRKKNGG